MGYHERLIELRKKNNYTQDRGNKTNAAPESKSK